MLKTKKNKYIAVTAGIALLAAILIGFYFILPRMSATTVTPLQQTQSATPSSKQDQSTPDLIQQAFDRGEITDEQRLLYLAYAIYEYESLPTQFHSNVGWRGTSIIMDLHEAAPPLRICSMSPSIRSEFQRLLKPNITCN